MGALHGARSFPVVSLSLFLCKMGALGVQMTVFSQAFSSPTALCGLQPAHHDTLAHVSASSSRTLPPSWGGWH